MNLEDIKNFLSNYTTFILQYIDENNTIFFSHNLVDFSLRVGDILILSKKEFDDSGDYIIALESSSLNTILNSIDYLVITNKTSI